MLFSNAMTRIPHKLTGATLSLLLAMPVSGAIEINTTNEIDTSAEFCSLREAIDTVNAGMDLLNGCGEPSRDIRLAAGATYRLTQPLPPIEVDVTIRGNDSDLLRDSNASDFRLLEVVSGELTLERLDLEWGSAMDKGGAVRVHPGAGLLLMETRLSHNKAQDGGAVYSEGQLIVTDSEFSQNHACRRGGAIAAEGGELIVLKSSFLDNEAAWSDSCGFSSEITRGGALFLRDLTGFEILNSTFHSLAERGGAIYSDSAAGNPGSISNSTFVAEVSVDGSALAVEGGTVHLGHTVLQGPGPLCSVAGGEIVSRGFNVAQDASCSLDPLNGDKPSTDPHLKDVGHHGGFSRTYAMSCTGNDRAPAIDIYECNLCEGYTDPSDPDVPFECLDQRGQLRPAGQSCDAGAYEAVISSGTIAGTILTIDVLVDSTDPKAKRSVLNDGCQRDMIDLTQADSVDQVVWYAVHPSDEMYQVDVEEIVFFDRETCPHDCFDDPDLCVQDCRMDPPCYFVMPDGPGADGTYTMRVELDACETRPGPGDYYHSYVIVFSSSYSKSGSYADTEWLGSRPRRDRTWRWSWDPELVICLPPK